MSVLDLRLPESRGESTQEQLRQLRSYLYQLTEQLQFALSLQSRQVQPSEAPAPASGEAPAVRSSSAIFAALKPLIIRSADIAEAYTEQVQRALQGSYLARSEFGAYTQETAQQIQENSQEILRSFRLVETVESELFRVSRQVQEVNAYVKTGLMTRDGEGTPIYGIEIGQQQEVNGTVGFRKYVRLSAQKLSFYDREDNEVAYISDRKLTVTEATVSALTAGTLTVETLCQGQYRWIQSADGHLTLV